MTALSVKAQHQSKHLRLFKAPKQAGIVPTALHGAHFQALIRSARILLAYQKPASSLTQSLSKPRNGKSHAESGYSE